MKTAYRIWERPDGRRNYREGSIHDSLDAAKAATGILADTPWNTNGEGNYWPEGDYRDVLFVGTELVPESIEDRVQLATDLIFECGQISGDHHKTWVLDQVVRILAGDRYEQMIADYCAGKEGPATYAWNEGIAP